MKANELRIGNFIYFNNNIEPKRLIKVTARFFTALAAGRPHYELVPDEELNGYHQPIPLTPSVLKAAGFVKVIFGENHWCVPSNDPSKSFEILVWSDHISYTLTNSFHLKIQHLHQLQNLYFALTGTELEIDLNKLK